MLEPYLNKSIGTLQRLIHGSYRAAWWRRSIQKSYVSTGLVWVVGRLVCMRNDCIVERSEWPGFANHAVGQWDRSRTTRAWPHTAGPVSLCILKPAHTRLICVNWNGFIVIERATFARKLDGRIDCFFIEILSLTWRKEALYIEHNYIKLFSLYKKLFSLYKKLIFNKSTCSVQY